MASTSNFFNKFFNETANRNVLDKNVKSVTESDFSETLSKSNELMNDTGDFSDNSTTIKVFQVRSPDIIGNEGLYNSKN